MQPKGNTEDGGVGFPICRGGDPRYFLSANLSMYSILNIFCRYHEGGSRGVMQLKDRMNHGVLCRYEVRRLPTIEQSLTRDIWIRIFCVGRVTHHRSDAACGAVQ